MIIFIVQSNEQEVKNSDDGTIDMEGDYFGKLLQQQN